jgi:hypothetical protein
MINVIISTGEAIWRNCEEGNKEVSWNIGSVDRSVVDFDLPNTIPPNTKLKKSGVQKTPPNLGPRA